MNSSMKPIAMFVLPLAALVSTSFADVGDLHQLKTNYEAACARVTGPLTNTYVAELQKLLRVKQQAGNPADIAAVSAELQRMGVNTQAPKPAAPTTPAAPAEPGKIEKFFVGKTWVTPAGTKFSFNKNGLGMRSFGKEESQIVWTLLPDNLIQVVGESTKGGSMRTWYFRFLSTNEGYYGDSKENPSAKLEKQ
jgi:hypothetical protein